MRVIADPIRHAVWDAFLPRAEFEALRAACSSAAPSCFSKWTQDAHRFAAPLAEVADPRVVEALVGEEMTSYLCQSVFRDELEGRGLDPATMAREGRWEAVVCRDGEGFELPSHVDTVEKAIVCLLYLAPDVVDAQAARRLGTRLGRGEGATDVEYAGNKMLAFACRSGSTTPEAYHEVARVGNGEARWLVNATLWLPENPKP